MDVNEHSGFDFVLNDWCNEKHFVVDDVGTYELWALKNTSADVFKSLFVTRSDLNSQRRD